MTNSTSTSAVNNQEFLNDIIDWFTHEQLSVSVVAPNWDKKGRYAFLRGICSKIKALTGNRITKKFNKSIELHAAVGMNIEHVRDQAISEITGDEEIKVVAIIANALATIAETY